MKADYPGEKREMTPDKVLIISLLVIAIGCFVIPMIGCSLMALKILPLSRPKALKKCSEIYNDNRELFRKAAENGDFSEVGALKEVRGITYYDDNGKTVTIGIGSFGFVAEGGEYGIYYSPNGSYIGERLCICPDEGTLSPTSDGGFEYRGEEAGDDNYYYVRPLDGNYFFYWEKW